MLIPEAQVALEGESLSKQLLGHAHALVPNHTLRSKQPPCPIPLSMRKILLCSEYLVMAKSVSMYHSITCTMLLGCILTLTVQGGTKSSEKDVKEGEKLELQLHLPDPNPGLPGRPLIGGRPFLMAADIHSRERQWELTSHLSIHFSQQQLKLERLEGSASGSHEIRPTQLCCTGLETAAHCNA